LTHADLTFSNVLLQRAMPSLIASSKLLVMTLDLCEFLPRSCPPPSISYRFISSIEKKTFTFNNGTWGCPSHYLISSPMHRCKERTKPTVMLSEGSIGHHLSIQKPVASPYCHSERQRRIGHPAVLPKVSRKAEPHLWILSDSEEFGHSQVFAKSVRNDHPHLSFWRQRRIGRPSSASKSEHKNKRRYKNPELSS
jgi:hypothetical protein